MTLMHLDQQAYQTWAKNYKQAVSAEEYGGRQAQIKAERERAMIASRNGIVGKVV